MTVFGESEAGRFRAAGLGQGCRLAITAFVLTQFVDWTLLEINGVQLSVQKVVAAFVLPTAVLLMRHIRLSWPLLKLGGCLAIAYCLAHVVALEIRPELVNGLFGLCVGLFASLVVYTALCYSPEAIQYLARLWMIAASTVSVVMVFQLFGLLPLFLVAEVDLPSRRAFGELYRATGFKNDPNIAALMLAIGIAFAMAYGGRFRTASCAVITAGILTTFSRMGIFLAVFLFVLAAVQSGRINARGMIRVITRAAAAIATTVLLTTLTIAIAPETGEYLSERFSEVAVTFGKMRNNSISAGAGRSLTSSETRVLLASGALETAKGRWLTGVGAYKTEDAIYEATSVRNVAHNTYLEMLLMGGVWGVVCICYYLSVLRRAIGVARETRGFDRTRSAVISVCWAFGAAGLFLSITYTAVLWMPVFLALALRHHASREIAINRALAQYANAVG